MAGDLAADRRADGARIHQYRARADGFKDSALPEDDFLRGGAVTDNGHDEGGATRGFPGRRRHARTGALERLRLRLSAVIDGDFVSAFQKIQRHRLAHDAGADESD